MKSNLLSLLKTHSFKQGNFKLSSGKESKYFIDCKQTLLTAKGHLLVGRIICHLIHTSFENIDGIAAVELGGCSIASSVSTLSNTWCKNPLDALFIRKSAKDHGTKNLIEGKLLGKKVILLEDTITTGGSSINALSVLKDNGYEPAAVISVVDRLEGGGAAINEKFNIPVLSLFTIEDFL